MDDIVYTYNPLHLPQLQSQGQHEALDLLLARPPPSEAAKPATAPVTPAQELASVRHFAPRVHDLARKFSGFVLRFWGGGFFLRSSQACHRARHAHAGARFGASFFFLITRTGLPHP